MWETIISYGSFSIPERSENWGASSSSTPDKVAWAMLELHLATHSSKEKVHKHVHTQKYIEMYKLNSLKQVGVSESDQILFF